VSLSGGPAGGRSAVRSCRGVASLRRVLRGWRSSGERIALVPTMGNLHAGHVSLVERARRSADRVVVSVYVNPTQFGPGEDFASYPRTLGPDRQRLKEAGADLLFAPDDAAVYPLGMGAATRVSVPGLSDILCGAARPGHFDGVASVVLRLFNMSQPDVAVFGRKDYQQLLLIERLVTDLSLPVRILGAPIVREGDGLAMSSRNQYLDAEERQRAPALYAALQYARAELRGGARDYPRIEAEGLRQLRAAGLRADYFQVRAADLGPPPAAGGALVVVAAAWCGPARLIDNVRIRA